MKSEAKARRRDENKNGEETEREQIVRSERGCGRGYDRCNSRKNKKRNRSIDCFENEREDVLTVRDPATARVQGYAGLAEF